jgi:Rps23 Pro-64 3,4-dihydroxylase Tpa1-like proline 4-hydroxylase
MKFEFIYEPVPVIIIRDMFTKKQNKEMLEEAISHKKDFRNSGTGIDNVTTEFRDNKVAYFDDMYVHDRTKSKLLSHIQSMFSMDEFKNILSSAQYPINLFPSSTFHETQVSRYGDNGQKYGYHIDSFDNERRQLTIVYYMNEEPKKYKGGEILLTRSTISKGKVMDPNEEPIKIVPENNMAVIFGARVAHCVLPTKSPKTFSKGRFSINCWIGKK